MQRNPVRGRQRRVFRQNDGRGEKFCAKIPSCNQTAPCDFSQFHSPLRRVSQRLRADGHQLRAIARRDAVVHPFATVLWLAVQNRVSEAFDLQLCRCAAVLAERTMKLPVFLREAFDDAAPVITTGGRPAPSRLARASP